MTNFTDMLSKAKDMQDKMKEAQEQIKRIEKSSTPQKKDGDSNGGDLNSNSGTPIQRPPNFNLGGSVAFSSPQTRDERGDTLADAIDEI